MSKTANEQAILNLADNLNNLGQSLSAAIGRVEAKLNSPGETTVEDLSEELEALNAAASGISGAADRLNALAPEVAAEPPAEEPAPEPAPENPIEGEPIDRDNVPVTPLAGESGGTDGVITGDPIPPGAETPVNPPADASGDQAGTSEDEDADAEEVDEEEVEG